MTGQRRHVRSNDGNRCNLRLRDAYYFAKVKNISLSGALMEIYFPPEGLHVGNNCQVNLYGDDLYNYDCEVVRVENSNIALRFIDKRLPN